MIVTVWCQGSDQPVLRGANQPDLSPEIPFGGLGGVCAECDQHVAVWFKPGEPFFRAGFHGRKS